MRAKKYIPILLLGLLLLAQISHSQNVYHINDQSNLSTCSAIVHDDGGEFGEYSANRDHVLTITNPNGNQLRLDFTEFDLELYYDNFIIYDGANTSADVMYNYNWYGQENKSPGTIVSSGDKITVRLKSDSYNTDYEEGFTFSVSCYEPNCDQNFPAGNTCADAVQICSTQEYCGTTKSSYTANTPGNLSSLFCGSIENNSFLKFTAASDTAQFEALVYGCTGSNSYWLKGRRQGVQFQVLSTDDCNNFNDYGACFSPGVEQGGIFTARGLTAGEDYLIMVDGYAGDNCNYSIRAINGVELPVKAREDIVTCNADSIRVGATFYPENSTNIIWTTSGDGTFSNNTSTDPYYYPGNADKSNGEVWVYVENNESIDPNCQQNATDSLLITITSVNVNLSPADLILCENQTLTVSANTNSEISENYSLNFADNTLYNIPDDGVNHPWNGQVGNYLSIPLEVNCLNEYSWNLSEICISATHGRTSDLSGIYLVNPCGDLIKLANANNIINGCITPGNNAEWQNFLSCPNPNGTWELRIADDRNNKTGSVSNFALQFNGSNYAWLNASNQVIGTGLQNNISQVGNYAIVVNNCQSNCNQSVDFTVVGSAVNYSINKQDISCFGNNNGQVVFNQSNGLEFSHNNDAYQNDSLFTNLTPGTHYFNIKNNDNCIVNDSIEILEPTKLTQDSIQNICTTPLPYTVNFTANGGTSPYTFVANNDTLNSNSYNVTDYGTVNYKVIDSNNCIDSSYFEIKESKNAGFSFDDPACGTLSTLIYLDEGCMADSFWVSNGNINLTDCGEYTLTANDYETITVKHIVQNGFCSDTATQEITFIAFPDPQFSVEELECGKLTTFLTVENPHANVSWDIFPLDGSVILPTLIPNKYLFTAIDFKSYQVKLNYDNNQCSKSNAETIVFDYELKPSITTSPEVCGLEAVLDVTNTGDNTPLWTSFFPGDIRIDNPISEQTTVTVSEYGTYLFYYIQESTPLCPIGVDTLSITFYEEPSAATVEDQEFCGLNSVHELTINPEIGFCVWNNLSDLNTTINNTYSISATQEGSTYHELLIKNGVCPENKDTFQITVFQEPEASITSDSMFVCGKQIQLNDFNVIGNQNWNSESPAFFANFNGNMNISNPDYGFNTFYLSAQNGSCTPKTDSLTVFFEEAPQAINFADTSICGTSLNLNIPQSTSFTLGEWSSNTLSINANQSEAMIEGTSNQTHSLTWTEKAYKVCNDYTTNLNVSFFSPTNSHAGLDTAVCGLALTMPLTDAPLLSNQHIRNWIISQDLKQEITGNEIFYSTTEANTFQVVRQDKNGVCPTSTDTAMMAFVAIPYGNAGVDQTVCGNETMLNANSTADFHEWSVVNSPANATLSFSDQNDPNSSITSNGYGEFTLVWTERNFGDMDCECEFTDTVTVTFIEQPILTLSNNSYASCNDTLKISLPNNLVGDLTWSTQSGLEITNNNAELVIIRLNSSQSNFSLDLQLNNQNTCYANDTVDLEFFTKPEITLQDSLLNCGLVGEFNLSKTEGKLAWNNNNANITENNETINFELPEYGKHNITFYLKNSVHCPIDSATINITAFEQPQLVLGKNQSICGKQIELTAQLNKGNIKWEASNQNINFSDSNALTTSVNTNLFGEYNITAIASNGTCPNDTAIQTIFFVEQPVANAGADKSICTFSTTLNGNENDFESYWKVIEEPANANSSITNPEQHNAQFSTDIPGIYTLEYSVKNGNVCEIARDTLTITVLETPNAIAGNDIEVCGLTAQLNANTNNQSIEWKTINTAELSFTDINNPTTDVTANSAGTYSVELITTNNPQCGNSRDTIAIKFVSEPIAMAGADTATCDNEITLSVNDFGNELSWEIVASPAGSNATLENPNSNKPSLKNATVGTYTLKLNAANEACTSVSDEINIEFLPKPVASAGNDIEVCGLTAQLNANTNNQSIEWKTINTAELSFTDINNPTTDVTANSAGTYSVELIATNNPQCGNSRDTIAINFVSEPIAMAGADTATCDNKITLSVNDFGNELSWEIISSPAGSNATLENPNSNKPSLINATVGTYTLKLNADNEACTSVSDEINIEFLPKPVAIAGNDIEVCGLTAQLNANTNNQNIEWNEINTAELSFTDINNPTTEVTATSAGTYSVELIATNNPLCGSSRDTIAINFVSEPIAMAGADTATCDNEITLSVNDFGNELSWEIVSSPAGSNATLENPNSNKPSLKNTITGEYQLLLTASKNNCNSVTDTINIRFLESASANAGADLSICGNEIQLQAQPNQGNGSWRQVGGNNITFHNPTLYNTIATSSVPGTYKLIWEENNGNSCPSATDTMEVVFKTYPTVNAGTDTNICNNTISLNPTTTSHTNVTWSVLTANASNVEFKNQNNLNTPVTFNDADTYKLQLSVEENGCTSTDSVNFTLWNTYEANAGKDTVICTNSIVLNSEILDSTYTTRWFTNQASIVKTSTNQFTASFPTAGDYTLYYEISNGQYCGASTDSMLVSVNKSIDFELANDTLICGDSFQLALNNLPEGNWNISPQQNISIENDTLSLSNLVSNTYTLYFEANQPEACESKTDSMLISIQNMPILNIDAPDSLCENESFYFNINSSTQDPFNFSFTFGADDEIYEIGADSLAINIPGLETSKQFVLSNISSLNNPTCISNQTIKHHVHINKTPTANIYGGGEFCEGDSVEIFFEMEGEAPYSLELSNNSSFVSNSSSFKTKISASHSDTITITTANDKYCAAKNNGQVKIKVNEIPELNIHGDFEDNYCDGDSLQITLEGIKGKAQFTVNSNLGEIKFMDKKTLNLSMNSTDSVIEFYTLTDLNNCTSNLDTSFSFMVNQLPSVKVKSPKVVCTDSLAELSLEFIGEENFTLYYETDNYQIANNLTAESKINFTVKNDLQITLHKISDANGCEQTIDSTINIEAIKAPVITLNTAQDSICQGDSALVFINVYGESDRYTSSLSINNETTDIILREKNERWIRINDTTQISFNNIRGLNLPLCTSPEYSINLFAKDTTSIDFMISENQVCNPATIEFVPFAETVDTNAQYTWTDNYGWNSNEMFATKLADFAGIVKVSLSYTNDQGCTSTITKDTAITVYEKPYADFNYNPDVITVQENKLTTDNLSEESYKSYAWILNDSLRSTEYNTEFYLNPEGADNELCLAVANENCVDTVCKTITVKDEVLFYIPNTFTPDGDGNNDTYEISAQGIDQLKFQVYNRFGHVVYETSNVNFSWDGVSDGEPCKQDTYQYLLTYKLKGRLKMKQLKGTIHLLR